MNPFFKASSFLVLAVCSILLMVFVFSGFSNKALSQEGSAPAATALLPNATPVPKAAEPYPKLNTSEGYVYDPSGRRDPFFQDVQKDEDSVAEYSPTGVRIIRSKGRIFDPNDPLQKYDLGVYRVIAIIWEVEKPKAIVKDQIGKVYTIRKGTRIGRNNGHVALIREGEVIVVEPPSEDGQISGNTHVLELKK